MPQTLDFNVTEEYLNAWLKFMDRNEISFDEYPGFLERASKILDSGAELIRAFPHVSGVAASLCYRDGQIVEDQPCITFFVSEKLPLRKLGDRRIPSSIDGIPTDVVEAGVPELHMSATGHVSGVRSRPAEPGDSIGHTNATSGTLGCLVEDDDGIQYVLSCAHVLSDVAASSGDAILQPGPHFGGTVPGDQIASLTRSLPLKPGTCIADAAIAEVSKPEDVTSTIKYVGVKPRGTRTLHGIGLRVLKSGDTTGLTDGVVTGIYATIGPLSAIGVADIFFTDAVVTSGMSRPGDSGSLLLDNQGQAIGLLFGGLKSADDADQISYVASWFNPIEPVLDNLGVHLAP